MKASLLPCCRFLALLLSSGLLLATSVSAKSASATTYPVPNQASQGQPRHLLPLPHELLAQLPAERVSFPEAGISLIQPPGFEAAALFDGFQQEESQASVMVLSLPAPAQEVMAVFQDAEAIRARGMRLVHQEAVEISGQPGILAQVEQAVNDQTFSKWILVFGDGEDTIILNASFPKAQASQLSAPLKASILSAVIEPNLVALDPEANAAFQITPSETLALALNLNGTLLYSEGGELKSKDPESALFIVSPSFSDLLILDQGQFARDRLQQTDQVTEIAIAQEASLTIDGLAGYEIIATAQDQSSQTPLLVYQTILFGEDRYFILQGMVGAARGDDYLEDFKAMAQSFRRR